MSSTPHPDGGRRPGGRPSQLDRRGRSGSVAGSLPLAQLLALSADSVQAVRAGRSLTQVLTQVPPGARAGVQALSFHVLRWLGSATELRGRLAPKTPPPAVDALLLTALALLWPGETLPYTEHTLVDQAVAAARQRVPAAAKFINAVLRRFLREQQTLVGAVMASPVGAFNHPVWWIERLRRDWPDHWQVLLSTANQRPPMTLRVNQRQCTAADYLQRLQAQGLAASLQALPGSAALSTAATTTAITAATTAAPMATHAAPALVLSEPCPVQQLPGFAEGLVSVQDAAAQLAASLLLGVGSKALAPGARVLDACAAPGGKTAHLLELADLQLLALDSDAQRLLRVQENLQRLQLGEPTPAGRRVQCLVGDARRPQDWWDGQPFDAILLDAPCTASGIVRRHPDVRWLRRETDVAALARTQAELLAALWPLLAPGGRLLYATCSIFKTEGQDQIDAFLQRIGPAAATLDPASPGHLLGSPDNAASAHGSAPTALHDGFFYALLQKT